jgi:predicted small secreted protein
MSWKALVILAVAAFALAGCNANQAINPCGRDPDCNPYDPTSYAQNQTGRGGGGH